MNTTDFDYDVVIVGSGPAGVSTWLHLHRFEPQLAARTLVLEKAQHPRPKLCGGGVMRIPLSRQTLLLAAEELFPRGKALRI
jgi:flavin-dependent dehydrogenase